MKIRLSGIAYESLVNGPGMRRVFFSQGCKHNCFGCFNPDTHDFNGGELFDADELIEDVLSNPMIKGITFSGGDPIEQSEEFTYMAKILKDYNYNIWCYTGYTYEQLLENKKAMELLKYIDVLVDGKFNINLTENALRFTGSSNQRIIKLKNGEML